MKRCPQCSRLETDGALKFCRVDGATLIADSSPTASEARTAPFSSGSVATENATSILPDATDANINRATAPTTVLPPKPPSSTTSELIKPKRRKTVVIAVIVTAVIAVTSAFLVASYRSRKSSGGAIQSIAVMPFLNESGNVEFEYLSDGITETLISSLSNLPNLNVKPRSTVFRYKGKDATAQAIGHDLGVQAVLTGRLAQHGQDLNLYVELIDVSLDKVVWSRQYSRKQDDLAFLQTDLARDVSGQLKMQMTDADKAKVTKNYTNNSEAYQLYLQGRFEFSKHNATSYQKAIEYYQRAIAIDPNYASAYVGIARAYATASDWYLSPNEAVPRAKAAALKAREIDDTLDSPHFILATIAFWNERDWATAEREWRRAHELDPQLTIEPFYPLVMGRTDEAIRAAEDWERRYPTDLNKSRDLEGIYLFTGRYDQAIEQARKTIAQDLTSWTSYWNMGMALASKRQFAEAITALEKARTLDNNPSVAGCLGYVYGAAGRPDDARRILSELNMASTNQYVPAYSIAIIHAGLNEKDEAFKFLNRALDDHSYYIVLLKLDPVLDSLRADPRFIDLIKKVNLPS